MYQPQWKCVKMLAIYMLKPNKRAFSTQFKIENRQTKKYAILSLNGLFFLLLAKLKHSIYETENDVIIWIADVAVATGCGGYSSFLACLLEHSVEFSYRCRDYDGRWCCTQAVHYLLLARYCYKLYIFIFKWISYELRERDCMKFSRLLSIGNLSSMENSMFLSKCQQRKRYLVHPLVVSPPHTSISQTAKCCAFIVWLHRLVDVRKSILWIYFSTMSTGICTWPMLFGCLK